MTGFELQTSGIEVGSLLLLHQKVNKMTQKCMCKVNAKNTDQLCEKEENNCPKLPPIDTVSNLVFWSHFANKSLGIMFTLFNNNKIH